MAGTIKLDGTTFLSKSGSTFTQESTTLGSTVTFPAGHIVQTVSTMFGAVATGTGLMALDDTIPQISEGNEFMTQAITPKSDTNKLFIEVVWQGTISVAHGFIVALFQDSTASALAGLQENRATVNHSKSLSFNHYMTSGTDSSTTFKVRAGACATATTTFNGNAGSRVLGGVMASSITIYEIQV